MKMCFKKLSPEIFQELFQTTSSFILNIFHLEFHYKNQIHGCHHVPSKILNQRFIILTFHICIWNMSLVWFLWLYLVQQIWIYNQIWKIFYSKLLGKGIQKKLYFNNIVSIKSKFPANWVTWKNVIKHWSNSWLGNCQIVSEECLQQLLQINYVSRESLEWLKILVNQKLMDDQ